MPTDGECKEGTKPSSIQGKKKKQYFIGSCISDTGASAYYRFRFVSRFLEQFYEGSIRALDFPALMPKEMLPRFDCLRLQRVAAEKYLPWLFHYLLPYKHEHPDFRIIYDVDDCLIHEDIPAYNLVKNMFEPTSANAIRTYMQVSDIISVSTKYLAKYYSEKLDISMGKFKVCPNRLPRCFFDHFHPLEIQERLKSLPHRKPRICFSCSATHVDLYYSNFGMDDFTGINQWIIKNRHKYQFVFQTKIPSALLPYSNDFEVANNLNFLSYPLSILKNQADLQIQPLQKNIFNQCKSEIKFYEAWAAGIPIFVQDIDIYKDTAPEFCFSDEKDLDDKITSFLSQSTESQYLMLQNNYERLQGIWLEDRVQEWLPILLNLSEHELEHMKTVVR